MSKLKTTLLFIKILIEFVLTRKFGNIIYDIAQKYQGDVSVAELRKFERSNVKLKKAELDVNFLTNCQTFNVFPKFICFNLPTSNHYETRLIRKRLLRNAIHKRSKELSKLSKSVTELSKYLQTKINSLDWYMLRKSLDNNLQATTEKIIATHEKKLRNLTKNFVLPFTKDDVITNMSSHVLTKEESDLLCNGLSYAIPPKSLRKTDVLTTFEMISKFTTSKLKREDMAGEIKAELSYLANTYCNQYKPSKETLKKHGILKKLRDNKNIIICRPDKGNGVVIIDKSIYIRKMLELLNDSSKFRKINEDPTRKREGQLQRFLRTLKGSRFLDDFTYSKVYPSGSQCGRLYGLPKLHKISSSSQVPPFRPVVSSIGTYNYQLAKYLSDMLTPLLPMNNCAQDTFTFLESLKQVRRDTKYMISFDVASLFTNIPLDETIDLAVNLIHQKFENFDISKTNLKKLFNFATKQSHFSFDEIIYDQIDGVTMGSPLAPALANLFLGHYENIFLQHERASKVLFYKRYVDDIFCIFEKADDYQDFFQFINTQHQNIKFTFETEEAGVIPF